MIYSLTVLFCLSNISKRKLINKLFLFTKYILTEYYKSVKSECSRKQIEQINEFKAIWDKFLTGILHCSAVTSVEGSRWATSSVRLIIGHLWNSSEVSAHQEELARLQYDWKHSVTLRRSFKINYSAVCLRCGSIEFLIPASDIDWDISSESMQGWVKQQWSRRWNHLFITSCFSLRV